MLPEVDRIDFEHPYPIRVYRQTIGGSERVASIEQIQLGMPLERRPGRPPKFKRIKGHITYEDITDTEPRVSQPIVKKMQGKLRGKSRA
jgi:predicted nucleic acid-binding OB-fold protein